MGELKRYPPDKLKNIYRKQKNDGIGDVIITVKEWKDSEGDTKSDELGFLRIRNPKEVENTLKKIAELCR